MHGSIGLHRIIERRTHRKIAPRSERYAAAFFGIGIGVAMLVNHLLQDSHFLVLTTAVFAGFVLAEMVAHAFIVISAFLLLTYEYGVRYTLIGRILNGPRQRTS